MGRFMISMSPAVDEGAADLGVLFGLTGYQAVHDRQVPQ
jgi:hypothetical protein